MHPLLSPRQERYFLYTLAGIQFTHILDFMIMMPLGPLLIEAFGMDAHAFGLLVASYTLSAGVAGMLATLFVDRIERKRLLLSLLFLFALATLACGLAPSHLLLLVARGLAGICGGMLAALVQTMVGDVIPYARRAQASGIVATAFAVATVLGVPSALWLANHFQWRAPFLLTGALALLFMLPAWRLLPELHQHLRDRQELHLFSSLFAVVQDANHLRALIFSALIILSGFTVIPYITLYAVHNVGISQYDIPIVYLVGGTATFFSSRWIGRWADRRGKVAVYRRVALAAVLPLLAVTQMPATTLLFWILCTTPFFVLVSGRMVPAITIITSSVQPRLRGTFLSLNGTVQSLSMGLATLLAGAIITQAGDGRLIGYAEVGYVAVIANLLAIWFVARIVIHD
ncbi:MAG: MFS transporter [Magnetococcus sp. XQGC-1]